MSQSNPPPPNNPGRAPRKPRRPAEDQAALKHGYYSRRFRRGEQADLELVDVGDLASEIHLLRAVTRRVFELTEAQDLESQKTAVRMLEALSRSAQRIGNLLRIYRELASDEKSEFDRAFSQALADLTEEWKLRELVSGKTASETATVPSENSPLEKTETED